MIGTISATIRAWQQNVDVEWHYIAPGDAMQIGFVECLAAGRVME